KDRGFAPARCVHVPSCLGPPTTLRVRLARSNCGGSVKPQAPFLSPRSAQRSQFSGRQRVGLMTYDATGIATKRTRLATGAMVDTAIPMTASVGEIIVRTATRRRSSRRTSMLNRLPTAYHHL